MALLWPAMLSRSQAGWDEWQFLRIMRYKECWPQAAPNQEVRSGRTLSLGMGYPDRLEACVAFAVRRPLAEETAGAIGLVAPSLALDQGDRRRQDGRRCRPQPCRGSGCRVGSGGRERSRSGREGMALPAGGRLRKQHPQSVATHTHVRARWGASAPDAARWAGFGWSV